jgi:hypothetical protein
MFAGKESGSPIVLIYQGSLLVFLANVRLELKLRIVMSPLAYKNIVIIRAIKSFVAQAPVTDIKV